jgi:hypothetical protein
MISKVIATSAFEIVKHWFIKSGEAEHKCLRIKNFAHSEVLAFLDTWDSTANDFGLQDVTVVVANTEKEDIPSKYLADKDKSITWYRNHNSGGLVYLETRVQSDEQGLQNIFTLTDSNFLDCSFDDPNGGKLSDVRKLVVEKAWEVAGGAPSATPRLLIERTVEVIKLLHPNIPVPVRRFVAYALGVCSDCIGDENALSEDKVNEIVGHNLNHLECFPDEKWRIYGESIKTDRRLYQNAMHADLVNGSVDIDPVQLAQTIKSFIFWDDNNEEYSGDALEAWRSLCVQYLNTRSAEIRSIIPYSIFSQLFELPAVDTKGLKLGEKIYEEISSLDSDRENELLSLKILEGLNKRQQDEAQRFLDAESLENDLPPLRDLISKKTRKVLDNLATPPTRRFSDPMHRLVLLLRRYAEIRDEDSGGCYVTLALSPKANLKNCSIGLFAFLFGSTLRDVCESSTDNLGGLELRIPDEALLSPTNLPLILNGEEGDEANNEAYEELGEDEVKGPLWDPVPLQFTIHAEDGTILESFNGEEWYPDSLNHFAIFWLLMAALDSPAKNSIGALCLPEDSNVEDWIEQSALRILSLEVLSYKAPSFNCQDNITIDEFILIRSSFFDKVASTGLSIQNINEYIDSWLPILETIRRDYVPRGKREDIVDAFLSNDQIVIADDQQLMCPYHPIRLRWIANYLKQGQRIALAALASEKEMELYFPEFYLNWLANLSPNHSPPISHGEQGDILYSKNETGWFEEFSLLESSAPNISMDQKSIESISKQIITYLESHPYKKDGLSILIVLPPTDHFPTELVESVRKGEWKGVRVKVTVALSPGRWEGVARAFERLHAEDRHLSKQALFPPNDLVFIEFDKHDSIEDKFHPEIFDIAIVTNILQESVIVQHNTEPPSHRSGSFDPLLDTSSRLEGGNNGGAISIVMRPRNPDVILESWSTLVVRSNRASPVSGSQEENTDFVELRINFESSSRLFSALHRFSHWVITLERHISRQQIESIEAAPDILSILEGVGSNGLSTLIVSSSSGRDLIVSRLERKLRKLIPQDQLEQRAGGYARQLAIKAYDETRRMAPRLALRAMGVSRVTEEIIGIAVARSIANKGFCTYPSNGISAWISLDEHTNWFGGAGSSRADLMWISMTRDADGLIVDILVVEGKLRQNFDPHGIQQVKSTIEFVEGILSQADTEKVDAKMWREEILSAIESTSLEDESNLALTGAESVLPNDIRENFREGNYRINSLKGLYSICLWNINSQEIQVSSKDQVEIIQSSQKDILALTEGNLPPALEQIDVNQASEIGTSLPGTLPNSTAGFQVASVVESEQLIDSGLQKVDNQGASNYSASRKRLEIGVLKSLYQQILDCFASHQIHVKPAMSDQEPFIEGPASILFKVLPSSGVDPRKLIEKSQALKLELKLDAEQEIAFGIDKGYVTIDVPKSAEQRYYVDAGELWSAWKRPEGELAVPLGEDRNGNPVVIEFSSTNSPHLLIGGTTGSGKSEALNAILYGLVRHYLAKELRLLLIDPKGTELISFESAPHLDQPIGWDDDDAILILRLAVAEMQRRYELFKQARKRSLAEFNSSVSESEKLPWIVVVVDEYADLTSDKESKKAIEQELKRLAQKARASGIHVIIATQKPSGEVISTDLRSNLPAQLALRVRSGTESRVIMEESGAEMLNGKGDAILRRVGRSERVQCAMVKPTDQTFIRIFPKLNP